MHQREITIVYNKLGNPDGPSPLKKKKGALNVCVGSLEKFLTFIEKNFMTLTSTE